LKAVGHKCGRITAELMAVFLLVFKQNNKVDQVGAHLTRWSRICLEKVIVPHVVKIFPIYGS
jgi:hypothetical protein